MKALRKPAYVIRGLDPNNLSTSDVALLLGISYARALRAIRELEAAGKIDVWYEKSQIRVSSAGVEVIRSQIVTQPNDSSSAKYQEPPTRGKLLVQALQLTAAAMELHNRASRLVHALKIPGPTSTRIGSIPLEGVTLRAQIPVVVEVEPNGRDLRASASDLGLDAVGRTRQEAVRALRIRIAADYEYLLAKERSAEEERRLEELVRYIKRKDEDRLQETRPVCSRSSSNLHGERAGLQTDSRRRQRRRHESVPVDPAS
jgi:hypothetical protein